MLNVFKSLLRKELGKKKYQDYFLQYQRMDQMCRKCGEKIKISVVYEDIYENLLGSEPSTLLEKQKRLRDAMITGFQICQHYVFVIGVYVLAMALILFGTPLNAVSLGGIVVISLAFLYKTYEFAVNKYSYLDAYIIIAYKAALEKRISEI